MTLRLLNTLITSVSQNYTDFQLHVYGSRVLEFRTRKRLGSEVVTYIAGYALTGPTETCLLLEPVLCCAQESCTWAARQWGSPTRSISEISASLIGEAGRQFTVRTPTVQSNWMNTALQAPAAGSAVGTVCPFHSLSVQLWTLPIVSW